MHSFTAITPPDRTPAHRRIVAAVAIVATAGLVWMSAALTAAAAPPLIGRVGVCAEGQDPLAVADAYHGVGVEVCA